jgi:hypothetical protein
MHHLMTVIRRKSERMKNVDSWKLGVKENEIY